MQDNDILFIPSSAVKGAMRTVAQAIPTAAAATIYRIP
jgi:CRISPR/Cas system CSM-associated protein Csm3 (group 7 of RAMP superfamily)